MTKQRSFASLTEEEINQVAEWLQHGTYDEVRDRIAKPRPEGFGLNLKSKRPLETLWQNKNTVDKINRKLAQGEKLTLSEFNAINSGEQADLPEKIQDVIMETTWELATSGENNPTQLLALQRLADFPARAEYREHKRQLELRKEQRDIQKQTHKLEMDQHRKHIDDERLILAQRAQAFREQQLPPVEKSAIRAPTASSPNSAIKEDDLGRLARTLDDVERRTCETFNLPYDGPTKQEPSLPPSPQTSSQTLSDTDVSPKAHNTQPAETIPLVAEPKDSGMDPTPALPDPSAPSAVDPPLTPLPPVQNSETHSSTASSPQPAMSSPSAVKSSPNNQSSIIDNQSPSAVPPLVKSHAIRRWRAHIPWPKGEPEPDGSWRDECPCGNPAPCSDHPELKGRVRGYKPQHPEFQFMLKQYNVPYYKPTAEEIGCTQAALDRSCDLFADNPRMKDPPDPRFHPKWLKHPES